MTRWFLVFGAVALMDVAWTFYILYAGRKHAFAAGVWSTMIVFFSAFSAVSYVQDHSLVTAAMAGAFIGTYLTVYRLRDSEDQTESKP